MSDEEFNVQKRTNPILAVIPYTSRFTLYQLPSPPSTSLQTALTSALLAPLPETSSLHVAGRGFLTITRTQEEWSIMIDSNHPSGLCKEIDEAMRETGKGIKDGPFACLRVKGPMDLSLVGIASRLLKPLTEGSISVFVISSYDTDYIFLNADQFEKAQSVLEADGWVILRP